MRFQHLDRLVEHPTIDGGHELVALRGRHETIRPDGVAVVVDHPDQQLVVRARALRAGERQDELRVEPEAARVDRFAQLARDVDIGEAAHEARIVRVINLDAVAATIFRGFAGGFRGRQ